MKKYCYVTLATNQTYLLGAKFLANFLKKTKTKYPIVLLAIENLKNEDLTDFDEVVYVPYLKFNNSNICPDSFNKLYIFNLLNYDKCLYLDADLIVFKNLDFLLENFSNYEFLTIRTYKPSYSPKEDLPNNFLFMCTPSAETFQKIQNNLFKLLTYRHDEDVVKEFLYPKYFKENKFDKIVNTYENLLNIDFIKNNKYFYHYAGTYKYFMFLSDINPKIFTLLPIDTIRNFLFNFCRPYENLCYLNK